MNTIKIKIRLTKIIELNTRNLVYGESVYLNRILTDLDLNKGRSINDLIKDVKDIHSDFTLNRLKEMIPGFQDERPYTALEYHVAIQINDTKIPSKSDIILIDPNPILVKIKLTKILQINNDCLSYGQEVSIGRKVNEHELLVKGMTFETFLEDLKDINNSKFIKSMIKEAATELGDEMPYVALAYNICVYKGSNEICYKCSNLLYKNLEPINKIEVSIQDER